MTDNHHMAVLAPSHPYSATSSRSGGSRFARDGRGYREAPAMSEPPTTRIELILQRLERGEYEVDAGKVADALLDRLSAGRSVRELVVQTR